MPRVDYWDRLVAVVGDVRPGEGRLIAIFMSFTFLQGMASQLAQVATYSLLLDSYQATILPWVYMGVAVLVTSGGIAYAALQNRVQLRIFLPLVVAFNAFSFLALWLTLWLTPHPWLRIALAIWIELPLFLNGMVFWELADRIFDIRQVKRLFGRIVSIGYLAGIFAGLIAAAVTGFIGAVHVIGLSCAASVGLLGITVRIQNTYADQLAPDTSVEETNSESKIDIASVQKLFRHPLASLIFIMVGITIFEYYIFDNIFYGFAEQQYPGEAGFALFYGTYSAAVNLVSLLMLGFVTNRAMRRFGVGLTLLIMPGAILLVVVLANGVQISGGFAALLFWLVIAGKFMDDVLTPCFNEASINVLYQALPQQMRSRTRTLADGVIYPICAGLAGLLLLTLTTLAGMTSDGLMVLLLVILIICFAVGLRVPAAYRESLKTALEKRSLEGLSLLPTDAATASMLESGLLDESPSRVLYCLDLLIERSPDSVAEIFVGLLDHPSDIVRRTALTRIAEHSAVSALPDVQRICDSDSSPEVRAEALLTLAALLEGESIDALQAHLESHEPIVQQGAIIGLLRSGGIEGVLAAGAYLLDMSRNDDSEQRAQAALVIGAVGISSFHRPLRELLADAAIEVRRAALSSARALGTPRLINEVAECLEVPGLRRPAGSALVAMGGPAVPRMLEIYGDARSDPPLRELLLGVLGRIGGESGRRALRHLLESHRAPERARLAEALLSAGVRAEEEPDFIHAAMNAAGRDAAWALTAAHQLQSQDETSVLARSLLQFVDHQSHAMLSLAGCLHPAELMRRARVLLDWPSAELRAYAVELLDNTLSNNEKSVLMPLIDGSDRNRQRSRLETQFPVTRRSTDDWLRVIAEADEVPAPRWLRCVALHELAGSEVASQRDVVRRLVADPDPVVCSSAQFVMAGWAAIEGQDEGQEGRAQMLSIVERVIFLKAIPIFAEIPEADLAELANRIGEERVSAGATIVTEGDLGTSMYMLASGTVRIHRGDTELSRMGEGEVFGELAALDTQPRTASVTAVDEALIFSIDQETLYEIMAEHPVMLRGIIRVLCKRLREQR